jgi:hypothetical protein
MAASYRALLQLNSNGLSEFASSFRLIYLKLGRRPGFNINKDYRLDDLPGLLLLATRLAAFNTPAN